MNEATRANGQGLATDGHAAPENAKPAEPASGINVPPRTASSRRPPPLSPDAFRVRFAAELGVSLGRVSPKARLREDLDLDSVRILELVLLLDDLGAPVEDAEVVDLTLVEDVYRLYVQRIADGDKTSGAASAYEAPTLTGRYTLQRPLIRADDAYVGSLMSDAERWASGRSFAVPTTENIVLLEHVVVEMRSAARIGVLAAYDGDLRQGTASLDVAFDRRVRGQGWPLEAVVLFIDHVFRTWPLRKLYAEAVGPVADAVASGVGRFFVEEGRFVAHEYVDGKLSDLRVLTFFREHWDAVAPRLLARIRPRE